ncbi:MAG: SelB C-terminal domain-containing protein [Planctomycetes bacterium]|nr:SelB C-terminal domain-containing protein [Planctomycetota bacterium]
MPPFSSLVLAAAGLSGHGKSALIHRVTGADTDRLPEEKRLGLTIDLGFAPLLLPDGSTAGLIDLPGSDRFARNMIAGAAAANALLLVVAADRGVEPGLRDMVASFELLGVRRGIVCLSRVDVASAVRSRQSEVEVRDLLRGTAFRDAPVIRTSATTGEGCADLLGAIAALAALPPPVEPGIFRMPVLRAFAGRTSGTVLTGVPISGSARAGELLEIIPGEKTGRPVRIESYHVEAADASPGRSVALHFPDLRPSETSRGAVVAAPGFLRPSSVLYARLRHAASGAPPIGQGDAVRVHCGAAENIGAIQILEGRELPAGREALVEIRLLEPVAVAPGDRFVLRFQSPPAFVGGGRILEGRAEVSMALRPRLLEKLRIRESGLGSREARVEAELRLHDTPATVGDLARAAMLDEEETGVLLEGLAGKGAVAALGGGFFAHTSTLSAARAELLRALQAAAQRNPAALGVEPGALQVGTALEPAIFAIALAAVESAGLAVRDRGFLRIAGHVPAANPEFEGLFSGIRQLLLESPFSTPRLEDFPRRMGRDAAAVISALNRMIQEGEVVRLGDGVLLHRDAVERAKAIAVQIGRAKGEVNPGEFRDALGTTRKYVIPILEHLEAAGVTSRKGGAHYLKA